MRLFSWIHHEWLEKPFDDDEVTHDVLRGESNDGTENEMKNKCRDDDENEDEDDDDEMTKKSDDGLRKTT